MNILLLLILLVLFINDHQCNVYKISRMDDRKLIELTSYAQRNLKIYIYEKPPQQVPKLKCSDEFRAESKIPLFFRNSTMITENHAEADAFIIDHDFTCMFNFGHSAFPQLSNELYIRRYIFHRHLNRIVNNVIHNYTYFNQSYGKDHFFIMTADFGPYCQYYEILIRNLFNKLQNVTFLLNFGYIGTTPRECVRTPGKDIIIPQFHSWEPTTFKRTPLSKPRQIDAYFKGTYSNRGYSSYNIRAFLQEIGSLSKYRLINAIQPPDRATISHSYFALCPAGYAPWSKRLYEALMMNTIPVILANGIVEPFEKFLNWEDFTVKFNTDNISLTNLSFLEKIHNAGEEHRNWASTLRANRKEDRSIISNDTTFIVRKLRRVRQASEWLHWNTRRKRSIWKLIVLEIWCRTKKASTEPACRAESSRIAFKEYWG